MVDRDTSGEDGRVPKPTTVWMVHLRRGLAPVDVRGTLELTPGALVFTAAEDARETTILLTEVVRAKRMRVTPILMVDWRRDAARHQTAFYFAKPPPLAAKDPGEATLRELGGGPFAALRKQSVRKQNRRNASKLATHGSYLKPTLISWASDLQRQLDEAKRNGG